MAKAKAVVVKAPTKEELIQESLHELYKASKSVGELDQRLFVLTERQFDLIADNLEKVLG